MGHQTVLHHPVDQILECLPEDGPVSRLDLAGVDHRVGEFACALLGGHAPLDERLKLGMSEPGRVGLRRQHGATAQVQQLSQRRLVLRVEVQRGADHADEGVPGVGDGLAEVAGHCIVRLDLDQLALKTDVGQALCQELQRGSQAVGIAQSGVLLDDVVHQAVHRPVQPFVTHRGRDRGGMHTLVQDRPGMTQVGILSDADDFGQGVVDAAVASDVGLLRTDHVHVPGDGVNGSGDDLRRRVHVGDEDLAHHVAQFSGGVLVRGREAGHDRCL